jgi:uncharacterized repeat protein (TIGR02543 family)
MKMKQKKYSKIKTVIIVMMCLVIATLGSPSVFAAVSDIPQKGWDRLIGSQNTDDLNGVIEADDGSYIAVGSTKDNPKNLQDMTAGDMDGMLIKTDKRGSIVWTKFVSGSGNDTLYSVVKLSDGSFLAAGSSTSSANGDIQETNSGNIDGLLVKFTSNGTLLWTKLIGGDKQDIFYDLIPTSDGGFLAAGSSSSSANGKIADTNNGDGTTDGFIIKFDSYGEIQWDNLYGSPQIDMFYSVIQTSDGGYVVAGKASGNVTGTNTGGEITDLPPFNVMPNDGLLVKFDPSGTMVWNNLFGSAGYDEFSGLAGTSDGGFIAVGSSSMINGDITNGEDPARLSALVAKFSSSGIVQWNRSFTSGGHSKLKDVKQTQSGNYIVIGKTIEGLSHGENDGLIATISSSGNVLSSASFGGVAEDAFNSFAVNQTGDIVVVGFSHSSQSGTLLNKTNGGQDGLISYFGESRYNVIFDENGGTELGDQIVSYGGHADAPEETKRAGYTFEGWYGDETFGEKYSFSAPILEDTTLYAKWYIHITMDNVVSDDRSINGAGEPDFLVTVFLTDGTQVQTTVKPDGTWTVDLPKDVTLMAGKYVSAAMYDTQHDGVEVSTTERLVEEAAIPPQTGDVKDLIPLWLFGLFLGLIIMRRAFKGPKVTRRS